MINGSVMDQPITSNAHQQAVLLNTAAKLPCILDVMNEFVLVLNVDLKIIFANQAFLSNLTHLTADSIIGLRFGEAMHCVNAVSATEGCGSTESCSLCRVLSTAQQATSDMVIENECQVMVTRNDQPLSLDLWVRVATLDISGMNCIMLTCTDISNQKRRRALERIFFHDLINIALPLPGFSELLCRADDNKKEQYASLINQISVRLLDEIEMQKQLLAAEHHELKIHPEEVNAAQALATLIDVAQQYSPKADQALQIRSCDPGITFITDKNLLRRVIVNMIKNALEAIKPGEKVGIDCRQASDSISFSVHNPGCIPRDVQLLLFHQSFSTKGPDRGLGMYSIKLLTEHYLQGKVTFTSTPETGTTFTITLPLTIAAS